MQAEEALDPGYVVEIVIYGMVEGGLLKVHGVKDRGYLLAAARKSVECLIKNHEEDAPALRALLNDEETLLALARSAHADGWCIGRYVYPGEKLPGFDPAFDLVAEVAKHFKLTHHETT